jgi:AraC-like DNA-binding protein
MPVALDTWQLPRAERVAGASAFLAATDTPCTLSFDTDEHLGHRFTGWRLAGGAQVVDIFGTGLHVSRTARHVRAAAPERICLAVQLEGTGWSEHRGVATATPAGHLNLIDATSESDYGWTGLSARRVYLLDYAPLGLPADLVRAAVGRLPASPLYDLVRTHLSSIRPDHEELRTSLGGAALAASSVELVRALIATAAAPGRALDAQAHDILRTRVIDYIERHLPDSDLGASRIARAHHISVRHLYAVWSVNPVPLREWIIQARLERARRELASGAALPVATVASRCGFADATHFARRFRDAYGMPASEWQRLFTRP